MFSSVLPGLRDLRVPLAAGALWLTVIVVLVWQLIPARQQATGFVAEVFALYDVFGPGGLLAALSFSAYILGILTDFLPRWLGRLGSTRDPGLTSIVEAERLVRSTLLRARSRGVTARQIADVLPEFGFRNYLVDEFDRDFSEVDDPPKSRSLRSARQRDEEDRQMSMISSRATEEVYRSFEVDLPLIAVRLHARSTELFDDYDRPKSEAEFRYAVAAPIFALAGAVGWAISSSWIGLSIGLAVGGGLGYYLFRLAASKARESREALLQTLFIGEVKSPTLENIEALTKASST